MMDEGIYQELKRRLNIAMITDTYHEFKNAYEFFVGLWHTMHEMIHPNSGVSIFYLGDDPRDWLFMADDSCVLWVNKVGYYEMFSHVVTIEKNDIIYINGIFLELMIMHNNDPIIGERLKLINGRNLISTSANFELMLL